MLIKLTPCDMPEKDIVTAYTMAATVQDTIWAGRLNNKPILGYLEGLETPNYPVPAPYYNCYDSELGMFLTVRNRDGNDVVVIDGWPNQGARQVVSITVD